VYAYAPPGLVMRSEVCCFVRSGCCSFHVEWNILLSLKHVSLYDNLDWLCWPFLRTDVTVVACFEPLLLISLMTTTTSPEEVFAPRVGWCLHSWARTRGASFQLGTLPVDTYRSTSGFPNALVFCSSSSSRKPARWENPLNIFSVKIHAK